MNKSDELPVLPIELLSDWVIRIPPGDWQVGRRAVHLSQGTSLQVPPPSVYTAVLEAYETLPVFEPEAAGWLKGAHLRGVSTQETTARFSLDPKSVAVFADPSGYNRLQAGVDYAFDPEWGTIGRLESGCLRADQPVYACYRCGLGRLDGIFLRADDRMIYRQGQPHIAAPQIPSPQGGEILLASVWLSPRLERLTLANLLPILEENYPHEQPYTAEEIRRLLPKTIDHLVNGGDLRILAWGDSVTDGSYLPDPSTQRWQEQFVHRLRQSFPTAYIELKTLGWGGRNTQNFLDEPPGSPYNYREQVLGSGADLVISEFVNDAGLSPAGVEQQYGAFLDDFRQAGMEWIILTPHYVRPDWMDLDREKEIDDDPRPYVAGLRAFAARHGVALADASKRWGRLWRQGIPYTTLLSNAINHPDPRGMKLFADALMALFEGLSSDAQRDAG